MAFKHPDQFEAVVAIEPTVEAALTWDRVPSRDRVHMPSGVRRKLFGEPLDHQYWKANHPTALAVANSTAIAAGGLSIYLEAGDEDLLHVQYGTELLHRCLFDIGVSHEYRLTKGGNHVGPSVGPRLVDAFRFVGRLLWKTYNDDASVDSMVELDAFASQVRSLELQSDYRNGLHRQGSGLRPPGDRPGRGPTGHPPALARPGGRGFHRALRSPGPSRFPGPVPRAPGLDRFIGGGGRHHPARPGR